MAPDLNPGARHTVGMQREKAGRSYKQAVCVRACVYVYATAHTRAACAPVWQQPNAFININTECTCHYLLLMKCACLCEVRLLCEGIRVRKTRTRRCGFHVSTFQTRHFNAASLPAGSKSSAVIQCTHQNNRIFLFKSLFSRRAIRQPPQK